MASTSQLSFPLFLLAVFALCQGGLSQFLKSKLACNDRNYYYMECPNNTVSVLDVRSLHFGVKPLQHPCSGLNCCLEDPGIDCTFQDDSYLEDVITKCTGTTLCFLSPAHLRPRNCQSPNLFPLFAHYTYAKYQCINVGHMRDVCDVGKVVAGPTHHVVSNVFFDNRNLTSLSCSCQASTRCGAQVVFKAVVVRLSKGQNDTCMETFNMADDLDPNVNKTITCQDGHLYGWTEIFRSDSHRTRMSLDIGSSHKGKLWVVIESSIPGASVEVRCGRAQIVQPSEEHDCPTTTPTTIPTTTTPTTTTPTTTTPSTTTSTTTTTVSPTPPKMAEGPNSVIGKEAVATGNSDTAVSAGIIAGVAVGAVLVIALLAGLLIVMICILKRKTTERPPPDYDGVVRWQNPDYDNLHHDTHDYEEPSFDPRFHPGFPVALSNPGYFHDEKPPIPTSSPPSLRPDEYSQGSLQLEEEGAAGGLHDMAVELPEKPPLPVSELEAATFPDPDLDNRVNESNDVTPQP